MTDSTRIQRYLSESFLYPIRDPLWRHIYLSAGLKAIVSCSRFQFLRGIKQLGPTHLVYPGATHTRMSHSLGVFELAKRTLHSLLLNGPIDFLTLPGAKAFLAAALLHDLGHFPYAHSLKELPLKEHEQLTAEFIANSELEAIIRRDLETDPQLVAAIVDLSMPYETNEEIELYRSILSGVLDPDKLDYLNRDAFFCGVSYGIQDTDFVLSKLRHEQGLGMVLEEDGLTAVENVLFSKYLMYRAVYWHRTVRAATAMIKKSVLMAMRDGRITPEDLYGIDDEDFARTFVSDHYPPFALVKRVSQRALHVLVLEMAFDDLDSDIRKVVELPVRERVEIALAQDLGGKATEGSIIIDIPEPVSFEAEFQIRSGDGVVAFPDAGTVFDRSVVGEFSRALRKLRVFVDPSIAPRFKDSHALTRMIRDAVTQAR